MRLCRFPRDAVCRRNLLVGATGVITNGFPLIAQIDALFVPPANARFLRQTQLTIALTANTNSPFEPVILLAADPLSVLAGGIHSATQQALAA